MVKRPSRHSTPPSPNFDSGLIAEPLLAFGGSHQHVDPKTGLALYGPYTLRGQPVPTLASIVVGLVGPPAMIADGEQWLTACRGILLNDGGQPFLYPHFPGFNAQHPYSCDLVFGDTWRESIRTTDLQRALSEASYYDRIQKIIGLYIQGIETLAQREPRPNVILCCIPEEVIDVCTVRTTKTGEVKRIKRNKAEKKALQAIARGQAFLFPEMDPTLGVEEAEWAHQNLRRGLKAEAMRYGIPTQLVWPRTLQVSGSSTSSREQGAQDIATRAWNFTTALYHKAGGTPWRLAEAETNICYVGISFYKELKEKDARIRTSLAQAFTSAGDGYVLRGNSFEWDEKTHGKSPHMDRKSASTLIRDVLDLYQRQNRGSLPSRIVVHKTSRFWEDELVGFQDACQLVPRRDFVALGGRGIQFYRGAGIYPPLRGTYVKFNETNTLLYTVGYIPYLRTYPGARVPQPLEILEHFGDSPWNVVLQEILSLSKMNWNTADFACSMPITVAFSRRVGQVLAELSPNVQVRSEYRFYM